VVPGARLGALTNKAGMSFSFMGIMLATARSIKDSDGGLEATAEVVPSRLKVGGDETQNHEHAEERSVQ
jgi:hypothetical protein